MQAKFFYVETLFLIFLEISGEHLSLVKFFFDLEIFEFERTIKMMDSRKHIRRALFIKIKNVSKIRGILSWQVLSQIFSLNQCSYKISSICLNNCSPKISNMCLNKCSPMFLKSKIFCLDKCSPKIWSVLLATLWCYGRFRTHGWLWQQHDNVWWDFVVVQLRFLFIKN